ncbi:MAG: efflux RND transporter periplasmic adaptor subunit [Acidobacteriia bacterium]|nr:efflux RND transporter periplasmic adaptor subunit [Terriglobia bacterium]
MNRTSPSTAIVSLFLAFFGAGIAGCSSPQHAEPQPPETVSNVPVIVVHKSAVPDFLEAVGTVRAAQASRVSSQTMGTIREIRAQQGDRVQAGQVLATIDDAQPRAAVELASAAVSAAEKEVSVADTDLALADATLKRYQQLFDKKSVSPQEFDEIKARRQSAEARRDMGRAGEAQANAALAQARTSLGYTEVRAPFAGVVTEKNADAGALASPGMPLFTLEDSRKYRLEATVDENSVRIVRAGQNVSVSLDALGSGTLSGKVEEIVPSADAASRSLLVKIGLPPDAHLLSGMFGRARFPLGARQALLIPQAAIATRGQLQGVYVIDANHMSALRYVTLGKINGQQVEVLSGLEDGETIVTAPGTRELGGKLIAGKQ